MNNHPISIVIFGASGDLTQRKLIPALFNLYQKDRLPEIRIIGTSRSVFSDQEFRDRLLESIHKFSPDSYHEKSWNEFSQFVYYRSGNLTEQQDYQKIAETLTELEIKPTNRLYYLAISPEFYHETVLHLGKSGLARQKSGVNAPWTHVIVENLMAKIWRVPKSSMRLSTKYLLKIRFIE